MFECTLLTSVLKLNGVSADLRTCFCACHVLVFVEYLYLLGLVYSNYYAIPMYLLPSYAVNLSLLALYKLILPFSPRTAFSNVTMGSLQIAHSCCFSIVQ